MHMKCFHCGQEVGNDVDFCPYCGASLGAGATVVLDQVYNPYAAAPESGRTAQLPGDEEGTGYNAAYTNYAATAFVPEQATAIALPNKRGLLKMILFGILTLGIYDIVIYSRIVTELNIAASRYDGKRTMPYMAAMTLAPFTLGIYALVWMHKFSSRVGAEVARRGINYKFGASTFWLWGVLGALIVVGPFVFQHKLLKSMNYINQDFNQRG